ncbi:MAG: YceI family protein [Acidimicrobiia bacterium]|nr:YceI family protein [Acidimicrobiia bacterium]
MKRGLVMAAAAGAVAVGGLFAWIWFSGDVEPSTELTAPPVTAAAPVSSATTAATSVTTTGTASDTTTAAAPAGGTVYTIAAEESLATFTLSEELRGSPTTVVGTTDQVAAEILIDFEQPSNSVLGTVVINARTLATDQTFRNRAIRGPILNTNTFEFITFAPTSVSGLPDGPSESYSFTVVGDLTIRDVTRSVTFEVAIESAGADGVSGFAEALVLRSDFDLQIPTAPGVANVADEVQLGIVFVARPTS